MLEHLAERAESRGFLILAPDSRGSTWDVLLGGYGPDVWFIDEALGHVFARYAVNRHRIGIGGFSDGASYALSLGIANGTLFSDILAFSPGFAAAQQATGLPQIFVSHGVTDDVLPIGRCSRRLVPRLRDAGYDVEYREFPDGHIVPDAMVDAALDRFLA
jgi:phospholipase/carboxylesterase